MLEEKAKRIRRLYGLALSIVIIVTGICLMIQCVDIYRSGDFSREIVGERFALFADPIYMCISMVVIGFVIDWLLPKGDHRRKAQKQNELILQRLHARTDFNSCDESLRTAVLAQQKQRKTNCMIRTVLCVLCAAVFLSYALNGSNFGDQTEITGSVIRAMYVLLPCCALPFFWSVFTAYHHNASIQREIDLMKQAASPAAAPKEAVPAKPDRTKLVRRVILVLGVAVLVYGYFTGGTNDVLTKAVNICTECVGLG